MQTFLEKNSKGLFVSTVFMSDFGNIKLCRHVPVVLPMSLEREMQMQRDWYNEDPESTLDYVCTLRMDRQSNYRIPVITPNPVKRNEHDRALCRQYIAYGMASRFISVWC